MIVHTALDNYIDLDRIEPKFTSNLDAFESVLRTLRTPRHLLEDVLVNRIKRDSQAIQSSVFQLLSVLCQKVTVSGHRYVVDAIDCRKTRYQLGKIGANQWFATCDSQFRNTCLSKYFRQSLNLFERKNVRSRQKFVLLTKNFRWHAVRAAEITTIRNRDAQISHRTV